MRLIVKEVTKKHLTLHQGGGEGSQRAEIPDDAYLDYERPDSDRSEFRSYEITGMEPEDDEDDLPEPPPKPVLRRVK